MMKIIFDLTDETIDAIILTELKAQYKSISEDIEMLERIPNLSAGKREDLKHNKKNKKAMARVIRYYSTKDEYDEWKESHK